MKFENQNQKLSSFTHFLFRVWRYGVFAFGLVVVSMTIGTLGYYYFANLAWIDSFHMASMILTGMGPVVELLTTRAKLFPHFMPYIAG